MRRDGIFGVEPLGVKHGARENLFYPPLADRGGRAIQEIEDGREATAANTVGRMVLYDIELFQGVVGQDGVGPRIGKRRERDFLHEIGVVFLDEIEQITEGLGGDLVPGKVVANVVTVGAEEGFQYLNHVLLSLAVGGLDAFADIDVVDRIALESAERFDRGGDRGRWTDGL